MSQDVLSEQMLDPLAELLRQRRLLVLTGAGISTASGIPDYRDRDGVRRGRVPIQGPEFRRFEAVRKRYWGRSLVGWPQLSQARPNPCHLAVAQLESLGYVTGLMTQNVDGLHQQAGSRNLVEMHGSIHWVRCLECQFRLPRAELQPVLEALNPALVQLAACPAPDGDAHLEPAELADVQVPKCPRCAGMLMPDVVFFGDNVPRERTEQVSQWLQSADALLVIGSSLMVYSGFRFCRLAADAGKPIAAINLGRTRADDLLHLKVELPAEQALPALTQLLQSA